MASVNRASSSHIEVPFEIGFHQVKGYHAASARGTFQSDERIAELKLRGVDGVAAAMRNGVPGFGCVDPSASPDKIVGYHTRINHFKAQVSLAKIELSVPQSIDLNGDEKLVWVRLIGKIGAIAKDSLPNLEERGLTFRIKKGEELYTVVNAFSGEPEIIKKEAAPKSESLYARTELKSPK